MNGLHNAHTRALSLQSMTTSSGGHVRRSGDCSCESEKNLRCLVLFVRNLYVHAKPTRCSLDLIRKPGLAESQCLLGLSPAGKLSLLFLVHPLCAKMRQHFLKRKRQRLGGEVRRQCARLGCGDLGFSPQQHKQQLLGRRIFY